MDMPIEARDISHAEALLAAGELDAALPLLQELAAQVEAYAQQECQATDERQWFSFADTFERLAYRRVERDPRSLTQLAVPFDRVYAALAFAHIARKEWEPARDALMQAVRWNPMNCRYRLDLAELFGMLGNQQEWAALSASVLDRAADAEPLARAYANLGHFFLQTDNVLAAEGCRRLAQRLATGDAHADTFIEQMGEELPELAQEEERRVMGAVEEQGIATSPSAEVAICLLMCASDAAAAGDRNTATTYTLRARDLIGAEAAEALIRLIRTSDAELAQERAEATATVAAGAADAGTADGVDASGGTCAAGDAAAEADEPGADEPQMQDVKGE